MKLEHFEMLLNVKNVKTTHVDVYCDECDKRFSAKRNLRRHIKKKHEIQDDTLSDMVDRAELVIQN